MGANPISQTKMTKFFKMEVIVEADNLYKAEKTIEYGQDMWTSGDTTEMTRKEIQDFFGYEDDELEEMIGIVD